MNPYHEKKEALLKSLQTSPEKGLTSDQAAQRLSQYGENKLHEKKKKTNLQRFFEQFKDVMIMILLLAAAVSFVIACVEGEPIEFFEPVLILLIVVLNAIMGMVQESKAEKALDALKNMSAPRAGFCGTGKKKSSRLPSWFPATLSIWKPATLSQQMHGC